jgi:cyclopropane-fatty-acyl-phospholipid synthase
MFEKSATSGSTRKQVLSGSAVKPLEWAARKLFGQQISGSLTVEFPSGRQMRIGQELGGQQVMLQLNRYRALWKVLRRGTIGFAEAYMDEDIDSPDLTDLLRFFALNWEQFAKPGRYLAKAGRGDRTVHRSRRNSRKGSRRNISEHYDLGNDFFRLWLDPDMVYSSGLFENHSQSLYDAQQVKLRRIVDLLDLAGGEEILEIGCGWGAFARLAANAHDANVTGVTLSHEQLAHAREEAGRDGLGGQCRFLLQDYRDIQDSFDHIVSIEMIEAVGEDYWPDYFRVLADRLKPGGTAVLQAITIDEALFDDYRRSADFIQRFIFPGGMLPTLSIIRQQAATAGLQLDHGERFGLSYARTLAEWRVRFEAAWPQIAELGYDAHFRRRWLYYLAYCEAGFREGTIDVGIYRLRKA